MKSEARRRYEQSFPTHRYLNGSLRLGHRLHEGGWPRLAKLMDLFNRIVFSADVPVRMDLPDGVFFMHNGLGTVVDELVVFKGSALIFQHVTLGHTVKGRLGCPVIGDDVTIGAGATVVGPVVIGDGSIVTAGSVVTRDVPALHKAIGNPAVVTPMAIRPKATSS